MQFTYPRKIDLACTPTPLQHLSRASEQWGRGHRIWIKRDDLTGSTLSGNKVRKLEFIAAYAIDNGYDMLITIGGVQSNHCRATAFVGAQLGLPVHLILRGEEPDDIDGNYLLDHLAGAKVSCYGSRQYLREEEQIFQHWLEHYRAQGYKPLLIPIGGSDEIGIWGYIRACEELGADFRNAAIDKAHIVTATGSGGTQAGLTLGTLLHELPATVWGINVCDDEQYFLDKIRDDVNDWCQHYPDVPTLRVEPRVIDGYVGAGYAQASDEVFRVITDLGRMEGVVLDPVYTGKAFAGMLKEIEQGRFADCRDIVFVHTGGIYGLFPQRDSFKW
jgi:D-cysteine desulfhydrase